MPGDAESDVAQVRVALPVAGTWSSLRSPGHDRFAFDLTGVDPDTRAATTASRMRHASLGADVREWHSWGRAVLAPVDGTVVTASDGWEDRERLHLVRDAAAMIVSRPELDAGDLRPFAGNHVILAADGFYVFLAHLRRGSVQVSEGDTVEVGRELGRVGNSGQSLSPHLHFELFDRVDDLLAAKTVPFVVDRFERFEAGEWTEVVGEPLGKGQLVRSVR